MSDELSAQNIGQFLLDSGAVQDIHVYQLAESTNTIAKDMARSGARHGTAVIAEQQSAGRARRGRSFFSPAGVGIYMSIVIRPMPDIPITAFAAVSVCKAIERLTNKKPSIKWPNDLILHDKKICGILTEGSGNNSGIIPSWAVIGIGINFMHPPGGYPEQLQDVAGAIFGEGDLPIISRSRLAAEIINLIREQPPLPEGILACYKSRMSMLGANINVICSNETYEAVAIDIDEEGRLLIQKENGLIQALTAGEITVRTKNL